MFIRDSTKKIINVNTISRFYKRRSIGKENKTFYICADTIDGVQLYIKDFDTQEECDKYFEELWENLRKGMSFKVS